MHIGQTAFMIVSYILGFAVVLSVCMAVVLETSRNGDNK